MFTLHLHLQISKDEAAMRGEGLAPSRCEIGPRSAYTSSLPSPHQAIFFISIGCSGRRCRHCHCHCHIHQGRASIAITHSKRSCQPPSGTCKWPTICQEPDASWGRAQERKEEEEEIEQTCLETAFIHAAIRCIDPSSDQAQDGESSLAISL